MASYKILPSKDRRSLRSRFDTANRSLCLFEQDQTNFLQLLHPIDSRINGAKRDSKLPRNIATMLGISVPGGSSGPASSSKTFHSGISLSLDATTEPAVPPTDQTRKNQVKSFIRQLARSSSRSRPYETRITRMKVLCPIESKEHRVSVSVHQSRGKWFDKALTMVRQQVKVIIPCVYVYASRTVVR